MTYTVLTLFPEIIQAYFSASIMAKAVDRRLVEYRVVNIRDFAYDKHKTCDDAPYGGGAGMLMLAEPVARALKSVGVQATGGRARVVYVSPSGRPFTQQLAADFAREQELVLLCGRYEGLDQRIIDHYVDDEVSVGDYVLSSGEVAALCVIDATYRLVDRVIRPQSLTEESFAGGLLEYPQWTRPEVFEGAPVPEVLLSGHHENIRRWRLLQRIQKTSAVRPDLIAAGLAAGIFDGETQDMLAKTGVFATAPPYSAGGRSAILKNTLKERETMNYTNFDTIPSYQKLQALASQYKGKEIFAKLDGARVRACGVPLAAGLTYNYAAKKVDDAVLAVLAALAGEQELIGKYKLLLDGEIMNTGENRKVLHQLLRGQLGNDVMSDGKNLGEFYKTELARFSAFAADVHAGKITGSTGKKFANAVQIGIGGSDLGPRALYLALENWAHKEGKAKIAARFISNVDPDDASAVLAPLDLAATLFILVSKSGTTQETLANELFVKDKLKKAGLDPARHVIAVTSETSPLAHNPDYLDSFYIDDFIGGRYSATSGVGGVILSLAFGADTFKEILAGAHEADKAALEPDICKNAALLDALIGVWERNFLGYPYTAVLPYSQALSRFPAHLQQLDMESNGKSVNRAGGKLSYATGPVVFGEPGTNGQHSFYQLLHQGTDIVPLQFIGFGDSQLAQDVQVDGSGSQTKLKANLAAQIIAFAKGRASDNPNKNFEGGRPSSLIYGARLTPRALGALLAHFENKVMFQGFIWNLNSFDQEGVQLGKILTKQVLAAGAGGTGDSALDEYSALLGV